MNKKTAQRHFRLTEFETVQLKLAARFRARGNESQYFRQSIWRDFLEALGSQFYSEIYTPKVLDAMVQHAYRMETREPPLCTTAERWLKLLQETAERIADDPYSDGAKKLHKAMIEAYPINFLVEIPGIGTVVDEAFHQTMENLRKITEGAKAENYEKP